MYKDDIEPPFTGLPITPETVCERVLASLLLHLGKRFWLHLGVVQLPKCQDQSVAAEITGQETCVLPLPHP